MIRIHDTEIDEVIDREMTPEEYEIYQERVAKTESEDAAKAALEAKKQEVLTRLGITADEAAALLS
jgi:hypothetical protein